MKLPLREELSLWITVAVLALVALLSSGFAATVPFLVSRGVRDSVNLVSALLPGVAAILVAAIALWATRLLVTEARRAAQRELELARMHSELTLAQKALEQRHDLVNHLTVVAALIQTDSTDRALRYLRRVIFDPKQGAPPGGALSETEPAVLLGLMGQKMARAVRAGVAFELRVDNDSEHLCVPDVVAARILGNLADNAIDAAAETPGGAGRMAVDIALSGGRCSIRVWNTGPEIPPDQLQRIFAAGETTKGSNHQGLGLHIVQQLVREYDGSLTVRSDAGLGTEFVVAFERPLKQGA